MFETDAAVVAMAPVVQDKLLVIAASRATPLGLLRRLLERCARVAVEWLAPKGGRIDEQSVHAVLESLTRQRGVRASLIVSERDGIIVDSNLRDR